MLYKYSGNTILITRAQSLQVLFACNLTCTSHAAFGKSISLDAKSPSAMNGRTSAGLE